MTLRNRSVARKVNREEGLGLLSWRGLCGDRSTETRHMRHAYDEGHAVGAGKQCGGPCRGSRSWQSRDCISADSAGQAGTDSPRLMCLLPRISSLSPGWERGGGQSLPSLQA